MWQKILRLYFGTPVRSAVIFAYLVVIFASGTYWVYETSVVSYRERLEIALEKIRLLENQLNVASVKFLTGAIQFREIVFDEDLVKEKAPHILRGIAHAKFALKRGDKQFAQKLLQEVNVGRDQSPEASYYLGIIAFQNRDYSAAIRHWQGALTDSNPHIDQQMYFYMAMASNLMNDTERTRAYIEKFVQVE